MNVRRKTRGRSSHCKDNSDIQSYKLHKLLTVKEIIAMKDRFEKQPGRHMSRNMFRKALKEVGKISMDDMEFDNLCKKIKFTRSLTEVYWEEFLTHIRVGLDSENIDAVSGRLELPISGSQKEIKTHHRLPVEKIIYIPAMQERNFNHLDGSYVTCSRDGLINYWSMDMELERTVFSKSPSLISQHTWITDIVVLPDVSVMCTSSTERDLRFYDTTAKKFELRVMITSLENMVTAMYYKFYQDGNKESKLLIGHSDGKLKLIYITSKSRGPFKSLPKMPLRTATYSQFLKGSISGMKAEEISTEHTDWVRQVAYYESIHCVVSISSCSKQSMLICSPNNKTNNSYSFKVQKGFSCFAIASSLHMVITGGPDFIVRMWNPFMPSRVITVLRGHHACIVSITLQDDNRVLVTLDKDKCVKIWDVSEQTCLQSYYELPTSLGERTNLCTYYNPTSRQLFVASNKIVYFAIYPLLNGDYTDGISHRKEVSVILYNTLFQNIITCGFDSYIIIWNPWKGKILVTGENRVVTEFADYEDIGSSNSKSWIRRHSDDILCSATYKPQILVTASFSGELVFWRMETGQPYAMYNVANPTERITQYKNITEEKTKQRKKTISKRRASKEKRQTSKKSSEDRIRLSVNAMICLTTRAVHPQIGTLLIAVDNGKIQMWSNHPGGGYLTEFRAIHGLKDYVVSLCTDLENNYLFTGHMEGYIKTWHLINYGIPEEDYVHVCLPELRLKFPFMWKDMLLGRAKRAHRIDVPILLNSFKAHLKPVTGIVYIDDVNLLISSDGSARIWTLGGRYIGTLGTFKPWTFVSPCKIPDDTRIYELPADIRRSASFTTIRVLSGGTITKEESKIHPELDHLSDESQGYGERVNLDSILGKHFQLPERGFHHYNIVLDTSLPDVPIYAEMVMQEPQKIIRPPTPELMKNLKAQTILTKGKFLH